MQQDLKPLSERNGTKYIILDNGEKLNYDLLINADETDYDCIKIGPESTPILKEYTAKSGKRVDVIQCHTFDENSVIQNGSPSYQSIEMMITVNGEPNSEEGKAILEKARKDYPLNYMRDYYYYLSLTSCLLALDKESYPAPMRAGMLSRVLREFYPKAEFLSKANDYEQLDNMEEGIQPIKFGKISNGKSENNKPNKELLLEQISQVIIQKVKGKINGKFSSEFMRKIDEIGAGKYLNDNLKNKVVDMANEKEENVIGDLGDNETNGIDSLIQDITEIIRRTVGTADAIQVEPQTVYDISDIKENVLDSKLKDIQILTEEIGNRIEREREQKDNGQINLSQR